MRTDVTKSQIEVLRQLAGMDAYGAEDITVSAVSGRLGRDCLDDVIRLATRNMVDMVEIEGRRIGDALLFMTELGEKVEAFCKGKGENDNGK
ncbi:MAG: hypothetical protein LUE27_00390 [Clostridia bacterium]|nr:hypothetical protein [Clostridia bacterium]